MSFLRAFREASREDTVFVAITRRWLMLRQRLFRLRPAPDDHARVSRDADSFSQARSGQRSAVLISRSLRSAAMGFLFIANEFATAVQHNIGTVTIVFNDGTYKNVRGMR
jgi:hypothetical protein